MNEASATSPGPGRCPECALSVDHRAPVPSASWTDWRVWSPWIPTLMLAGVLLVLSLRPGLAFSSTMRAPQRGSTFFGDLLTPADLERINAGDALTRSLLETMNADAERIGVPFELVVGVGPTDARLTVVRTRGWPFTTRQDVFTVPFDATGPPPEAESLLASEAWVTEMEGLLARSRSRGSGARQERFTDATPLLLGLVVADVVRRITRRVLRARASRPRTIRVWSLVAGALVVAATIAGACVPVTETRTIAPDAFASAPLAPTGLTPDDLRALVGRDDADRTLADAILTALQSQPSDAVIQAAFCHTVTWHSRLRRYGSPWQFLDLWYVTRRNLTRDDVPIAIPASWGRIRPWRSFTFLEVPRTAGSTTAYGLGINHTRAVPWIALVYAVALGSAHAAHLVSRLIARRRAARGRCVGCGYPLVPAA